MGISIFKGEQGNALWHNTHRAGIPTGSEFSKIVTPKGAFSKSSLILADTKAFERFTGIQEEKVRTFAMKEGHRKENIAIDQYSLITGIAPTEVAFIRDMDKPYGISPDFVSLDRNDNITHLAEIKSLEGGLWSRAYRTKTPPSTYHPQLQGQLLTCELDKMTLIMFSEDGGIFWFPVYRDEAFIAKLEDALYRFNDEVEKYHQQLLSATDIYKI